MKNIQVLIKKKEIIDHIGSLWKTNIFQESHLKKGGYINNIVQNAADIPVFFYSFSNEYLERGHFSPWWRGIGLRSYQNDVVHDLYLLHEISHLSYMRYYPNLSYNVFKKKQEKNEHVASIISELEVYLALPELRHQSFKNKICFDYIKNRSTLRKIWQKNKNHGFTLLEKHWSEIKKMDVSNEQYKWVQSFDGLNNLWFEIWKNKFNLIESRVMQLKQQCTIGSEVTAMESYMSWLISEHCDVNQVIPFMEEAELFAEPYWIHRNNWHDIIKYNSKSEDGNNT
jgi:hypothetical protein